MRWLACAWLLVVGCFDPPTGPPYEIRLVSADPPVVSIHGGDWVSIRYEGELPENIGIAVDGMVAPPVTVNPVAHTFTMSAPVHETGPVDIGLYDTDRGRAIAYEPELLAYRVMPPKPAWNLSSTTQQSLDWPVHPELSHPCARGGDLYIENLGDELLSLMALRSTNNEFTLGVPPSRALEYGEYYTINVCFTSQTPGTSTAVLTASTNAGDVNVSVDATVTQPLSGLDPTFHGGGVVFGVGDETYSGRGVVGPGGNGILTWSRARLSALDLAGTETHVDVSAQIGTIPADWILGVGATPSSGIYVLVANSQHAYATILHFTDALVLDDQVDLPFDPANPYTDLYVAPGRLLAIGQRSVVAIANGVVDTTYGTAGRATFPTTFVNHSVIDSQGRVYAAVGTGMIRLAANGAIDGSFSYNYSPSAMTIDGADRVYVQIGNHVSQLSETGVETQVVSNALFANNLTVDASGRIYLVSGAGVVQRYSNGTLGGTLGYGNASMVVCPPSGGCYLLGVDVLTQIPFTTGPDYIEKYVLRLAN